MKILGLALPTVLTGLTTLAFFVLERVAPGRKLPHVRGWYARALGLNAAQLALTLVFNKVWVRVLSGHAVIHLADVLPAWGQGLACWFTGTFCFYWWHRARHANGLWRVLHQVHHSPARIEVLTSFYKHPVEMVSDTVLSAAVAYVLLGISLEGAFWFNFFAATGEYFYHANFKSPRWLKYLVQTPELHSVHHELDVHAYNYADLPLWDRLFGTYRDADEFVPRCGFPNDNERKLGAMLAFRDVYRD